MYSAAKILLDHGARADIGNSLHWEANEIWKPFFRENGWKMHPDDKKYSGVNYHDVAYYEIGKNQAIIWSTN